MQGDYTINPTGPLGSQSALAEVEGPFIGTFDTDEEAIKAAQERMEQEQFWPNIWIVSDHGNAQLWSPDSE